MMPSAGVPDRKEKAVADGQARDGAGRRSQKSDAAFRTISEVATELDVPQHVLRFWETKFSQIRPMKRGGGRRYYRPEDVILLTTLRDLLYREGYTIKGVQKLLRDNGARALVNAVQERKERTADGASVGPVGLALAERREPADPNGMSGADSVDDAVSTPEGGAAVTGMDTVNVADEGAASFDAQIVPEGTHVDETHDVTSAVSGQADQAEHAVDVDHHVYHVDDHAVWGGLDAEQTSELTAILDELTTLRTLLRQALDSTSPPPAPPGLEP